MAVMVRDAPSPLFSVVIPTYNRASLLPSAIASVWQQTLQDFEIIVVDNGSTDNTRHTIASLEDQRIRYVFQKGTGSPAAPRNHGIALSRGMWIAFLDSDDEWEATKLEEAIRANLSGEYDLIVHWQSIRDSNGREHLIIGNRLKQSLNYKQLLLTENCIATSSVVMRRTFLEKNNLTFNEEERYASVEDYDLWLRALLVGARAFVIRKVLGTNRETEDHLGTQQRFFVNMTHLLKDHAWKVQDFAHDRLSLEKRLTASLVLRRACVIFRERQRLMGLRLIVKAVGLDPIEVFRYIKLRLIQRFLL
jgi:glycosyltransferase involved in cell wall biosynthesis